MLTRLQMGERRLSNPLNPPCIPPKTYSHKENLSTHNNLANQYLKPRPLISPSTQHSERQSQQPLSARSNANHQQGLSARNRQERSCQNHPGKKAEYSVLIENEEEEIYCGRCAAQLATQGFDVLRIEEGSLRASQKDLLPYLPEYESEPMYQEVLEILKMCNSVKKEHKSNMEQFSGLEAHYQEQITLTSAFYDDLIDVIEAMKRDHLEDLHHDRSKKTQQAYIANDLQQENITEIQSISNDIETHLEQVMQEVIQTGQRKECQESLQHYRQKLTLLRHQGQERLEILKDVPSYTKVLMDRMMDSFEQHLQEMWDQDGNQKEAFESHSNRQNRPNGKAQNFQKNPITVKNIHQILPKGGHIDAIEGKKAFRNLEDEEQGEHFEERRSPNFKRI